MTQTNITVGMTELNCGTIGSALTGKGGEVWMRLIDADDLAAKIMMEAPDFMDGGSSITKAFILAMVKTRSATPTIDAIPVVCCEKCIFADDFDIDVPPYVGYLCQKGYGSHTGDWYCGDGKKEGDDHEETVAGGG